MKILILVIIVMLAQSVVVNFGKDNLYVMLAYLVFQCWVGWRCATIEQQLKGNGK